MRLHISGMAVVLACMASQGSRLAAQGVTVGPAPVSTVTELVRRQLRSDDPREVAWGAYLAAQNQFEFAVPLLQERLASLPLNVSRSFRNDSLPTALAILDALVLLDARVPARVLRSWFDPWPVQTLILLAQASDGRDETLLSLLNATSGPAWTAVANLLLTTKPAGFARQLLTGLRLPLTIYVTDQPGLGFGSGASDGGEGGMVASIAVGFPPLVNYRFSGALPGATLLSLGPVAAYYTKRIGNPSVVYTPEFYRPSPSTLDRVLYINALATDRYGAGWLVANPSATILWTSAQEFRRQVDEAHRRVEAGYTQTVSLLVTRGYLTAESDIPHPEITATVSDQRKDRSATLPAVK